MYFYPTHQSGFYTQLEKVRLAAVSEAKRLYTLKKIDYVVERTKPKHFGYSTYKIPANAYKAYRVNDYSAIFFAGIFNNDDSFDYVDWWEGNKSSVIGEWFVRDIYYFQERQGIYAGNLDYYKFKPSSSFTFYAHDTTVTSTEVDGWFVAFTVVPETERDNSIVTAL